MKYSIENQIKHYIQFQYNINNKNIINQNTENKMMKKLKSNWQN